MADFPSRIQILQNPAKPGHGQPRKSKEKAWIAMSSAIPFFPNFKGLSYKRQALPARLATLSQHLFYESQPGLEWAGEHSRMDFARSPKRSRAS
jgi:hypothetical protein